MRTGKVEIRGHEYVICLSARVIQNVEDAGYPSIEAFLSDEAHQTGNLFRILAWMIEAGDRWERHEGRESPGTLSYDEILDTIGPEDLEILSASIVQAIVGERHIEAQPPKNAKTTRKKAPAA